MSKDEFAWRGTPKSPSVRNCRLASRFARGIHATLLTWLLASGLPLSAGPPRYTAMLQSGKRIEGDVLSDWHATASQPKLDGAPLLEGDRFRWLRDRRIGPEPSLPLAFVELFGGDRLPGRVTQFRPGGESPDQPAPPHAMVEPSVTFWPPQAAASAEIRVLLAPVRRLVWQASGRPYQPGTAFYRDGRRLAFRAIRFGRKHIDVLGTDGRARIAIEQLAELHLANRDFWPLYLEELAVLSPKGQGPNGRGDLLHVETVEGLRLTASLRRFRAYAIGGARDASRWVHGLQPAWSLDTLWIRHNSIWSRRLLAPEQLPLTRLPMQAVGQALSRADRAAAAPLFAPRIDRNVLGGPLRSGGLDFGWGLGVLAESRLAFDVPAAAIALRTSIGLDSRAGRGGCVRARVLWDSRVLYSGPLQVGSQDVADSGRIALPERPSPTDRPFPTDRLALPSKSDGRLILHVGMAHDDRPKGADPLNIRDLADWLDPVLELDRTRLQAGIRQRIVARFPAWNGWDVDLPDGPLTFPDTWDSHGAPPGCFLPAIGASRGPIRWSRRLTIGPRDQWLVVDAVRLDQAAGDVSLTVRIEGRPVAEVAVPLRGRRSPPPDAQSAQPQAARPQAAAQSHDSRALIVPLRDYRSAGEVQVEIVQSAGAAVHWRAIRVTEKEPTKQGLPFGAKGGR